MCRARRRCGASTKATTLPLRNPDPDPPHIVALFSKIARRGISFGSNTHILPAHTLTHTTHIRALKWVECVISTLLIYTKTALRYITLPSSTFARRPRQRCRRRRPVFSATCARTYTHTHTHTHTFKHNLNPRSWRRAFASQTEWNNQFGRVRALAWGQCSRCCMRQSARESE